MKIKGVFLAAILTAVLCISGNLLAYSGGTGEPNDPYKIANVADFNQLTIDPNNWNKSFILTADVNLAEVPLTPVGNSSKNFTGVFDGNDNIVSNAVINQPGSNAVGLFGRVGSGGQIRNVGVEDVNMNGGNLVGGLVGWNSSGTITSCNATGSVTGGNNVGGLMGYNSGTLTSCNASGSVIGTGECVGGLVGWNDGTLTYCYATGSVSGDPYIGGLVGFNYCGTLTFCYAIGSASGNSYVGGLVGWNFYGTITSCNATGSVTGSNNVGGLTGYNSGPVTSCYATGSVSGTDTVGGLVGSNSSTVSSSYSTGSVTGAIGAYVGGVVGYNAADLTRCFWDKDTSDKTVGVGSGLSTGVTGKTTAEMMTLSTFTDANGLWDFLGETTNGTDDYWRMCVDGVDYPRLTWEYVQDGDFACPDGVGFDDLQRFGDDWLLTYSTPFYGADANGDKTVNFLDFAILADNWLNH